MPRTASARCDPWATACRRHPDPTDRLRRSRILGSGGADFIPANFLFPIEARQSYRIGAPEEDAARLDCSPTSGWAERGGPQCESGHGDGPGVANTVLTTDGLTHPNAASTELSSGNLYLDWRAA